MSYANVRLILFSALVLFSTLVGCDKTTNTTKTSLSSAKELVLLSVKDAKGNEISPTVVEATGNLDITVPFGTNNKELVIAFTIAPKAKINPDPTTVKDYSIVQQFTVTAEDGTKQSYSVTVIIDKPKAKTGNSITKFTFNIADNIVIGVIDETAKTIAVRLPFGTARTGLVPTIEISEGATLSPNSGTSVDFTNAVQYTVTAENNDKRIYTVEVDVAVATARTGNSIQAFGFIVSGKNYFGIIDETDKTIIVKLPFGTSLAGLAPRIQISDGATVSPNSGTSVDFTRAVRYTVTAENSNQNVYTVMVDVASATAKTGNSITRFSFRAIDNGFETGRDIDGVIDESDPELRTIRVYLPYGSLVTGLKPTIEFSEGAKVSSNIPTVGDFTESVVYTITAQNGDHKEYNVVVFDEPKEFTKMDFKKYFGKFYSADRLAVFQINQSSTDINIHTEVIENMYDNITVTLDQYFPSLNAFRLIYFDKNNVEQLSPFTGELLNPILRHAYKIEFDVDIIKASIPDAFVLKFEKVASTKTTKITGGASYHFVHISSSPTTLVTTVISADLPSNFSLESGDKFIWKNLRFTREPD